MHAVVQRVLVRQAFCIPGSMVLNILLGMFLGVWSIPVVGPPPAPSRNTRTIPVLPLVELCSLSLLADGGVPAHFRGRVWVLRHVAISR